ncbi:ABC transporter substrate-binding protein [Candidatus Ferrigenium straubiae]|jgi:urea transport system substrate-binding protein|uniref:ABC transporter substrate-binding protein n=1 Tax=Candidatus Ferrigenium straubiae TaxID=2919506 RepID=UPI003F4AF21E
MQNLLSKRSKLPAIILLAAVLLAGLLLYDQYGRAKPPIKIGVPHSLTGTMAASEAPLVDAIRLAVEEANQTGGLNGRPVEMIVADCRSDDAYCAEQAEKLIAQDKVQALFGCWTSNCRKAVKPVVEKHHHLLFYPLQYEGLEQSPDIVYTGAVPNQQIIPMALWALRQYGKRYYLIGSDYVFPRTVNRMVKDVLLAQGGQLTGERYQPLGASDMAAAVNEIAARRPDFILNTLNGDSNRYFFRALKEAGIDAEKIPVFSTSIAEVELAAMEPGLIAGHYAAWNYFQGVDSAENKAFIARFRQRFGKGRVLDDPMEASYIGAMLWADSVRSAGTTDLAPVKNVLAQQSMSAPEGIVAVDFNTGHLWKTVRIGKARPDGQFDIVWQSEDAVHPAPFPFYRSRQEWLAEQKSLMGSAP